MSSQWKSSTVISLTLLWWPVVEGHRHPVGWTAPVRSPCMATPRRERRKRPVPNQGFGAVESPISKTRESSSSSSSSSSPEAKNDKTQRIYSMPGMYDLAFGYRNYDEEVNFLMGQHQRLHDGKFPTRTLELAAGPARHTVTALQHGQIQYGIALDNSPEMVDYGIQTARMELDIDAFESFEYLNADMAQFELTEKDQPVDSAWILLGSLQHMTENDQVISCLESIHKVLSPGGTLIVELPHPRETFSLVECTRNGWEVPLEDENGEAYGELEIIWGDADDDFDPIRQVRQFTVAMNLKGVSTNDLSADLQNVREIVPLRHFTAQEIDALARISGFRVESMHGALCEGVDVNDDLEAFRLVCVLQKV